ncbi:helix-turn-helix domain-containing protein [Natronosporangium hydrolyticum]|uniref:Helix-turn-helix domain-containing protein n=1 Tax=Natronosporangium hydrolyticum TaxID=2811111 RepID=A0A895YNG0_9ACTN|nr:helix-turn-helix domain-containing protein [Natronosporangium hydrolyticum]QSB15468.1 helix-turn-helix domain-containing protein [Natronosporangium hydrolyticum]
MMRIEDSQRLGLIIRLSRARLGQTQAQLAAAAGVSRRWLSDLEHGKPRAEIGLVFRTLDALGLRLVAEPALPDPDEIDLDQHLATFVDPPPATREAT